MNTILWILIGIAILCAGIAIYFGTKKKKQILIRKGGHSMGLFDKLKKKRNYLENVSR